MDFKVLDDGQAGNHSSKRKFSGI